MSENSDDLLKCNFQKCADCKNKCPVYEQFGFISYSARGKMNVLQALNEKFINMSPSVVELFYNCALCGYCEARCANKISLNEFFLKMRNRIVNSNQIQHSRYKECLDFLKSSGNPYGKNMTVKNKFLNKPYYKKDSHNLLFTGCNSVFISQEVGENTANILGLAGAGFNHLGEREKCCGYILYILGYWEDFIKLAEENVDLFKDNRVKRIITPCPGCYRVFSKIYPQFVKWPNIKVLHISEYIWDMVKRGNLVFRREMPYKIAFHDPCDLGRGMGVFEPPRQIMRKIPGIRLIELDNNRNYSICCGGGGGLLLTNKNLVFSIASNRLKEAFEKNIDILISSCPLCSAVLKQASTISSIDLEVKDLTSIVCEAVV